MLVAVLAAVNLLCAVLEWISPKYVPFHSLFRDLYPIWTISKIVMLNILTVSLCSVFFKALFMYYQLQAIYCATLELLVGQCWLILLESQFCCSNYVYARIGLLTSILVFFYWVYGLYLWNKVMVCSCFILLQICSHFDNYWVKTENILIEQSVLCCYQSLWRGIFYRF